jgi:REP element-mobilizing transposase RayT
MSGTPRQSALRKGRADRAGHGYFLTTATAGREPLLASAAAGEAVIATLRWLRAEGRIRLLGFVVMPDHLHVAIALEPGHTLRDVVRTFKSYTARRLNRDWGRSGPVWQPQYYDHALRDRRDFLTRLTYMHGNPVRKGLAPTAESYEPSTAHPRYAGDIDWGWVDALK